MERTSRETWAKRVERWKDSGLTAAEYAAETGINVHSLSWWKWRLASGAAKAATARVRKGRRAPPPMTFVEVPTAVGSVAFEVILRSSVTVRVPPAFDGPALGRLLDVLEKR